MTKSERSILIPRPCFVHKKEPHHFGTALNTIFLLFTLNGMLHGEKL